MKILQCEFFPVRLMLIDNEDDFYRQSDKLTLGIYPPPMTGMTYYIPDADEGALVVVALGDCSDMSPFDSDLMLVHEAVHVMQFLFEVISEKTPGAEIEAYAVQYFSKYLISERWRLTALRKRATVRAKSKRRTT